MSEEAQNHREPQNHPETQHPEAQPPETQPDLDAAVDALLTRAGVTAQRGQIRRLLRASLGLGADGTRRLDLKIAAAALEEMRTAFHLFRPYLDVPKVTVFGSARTRENDPLWTAAHDVSKTLAGCGWTVVTGAGPGIMEAAAVGAGPEQSLGVSIRLPFEESPNETVTALDDRHVAMKYFFTRKLMLVKESKGFICLPGGFGTMDETFELLTLQQTGKAEPVPIVLLDRPGGTFWKGFEQFAARDLEGYGMISPGDLDRVLVTDSVDAAIAEITGFWDNYDSLRWVGKQLVLRLPRAPAPEAVAGLSARFSGLCAEGGFAVTDPLPEEVRDNDRLECPRIVFTPQPKAVGELHRIIRALNKLP